MYRHESSHSFRAAFAATAGLLVLAVAVAPGCHDGSSPTEPSPAGTVALAVGQTVAIGTGSLLSFDRVVSDSRCPSGVACVWEGEVTVALALSDSTGRSVFTLSDHAPTRSVSGYSFTLASVQPAPTAGSTIPEVDYRATVKFARSAS